MPVLGIGTDLLKISRFNKIIERNGGLQSERVLKLAGRILNNEKGNRHNEYQKFIQFQQKDDLDGVVRILGNSWCTKEALYKSLSTPNQSVFKMRDWYKFNSDSGLPLIQNDYYQKLYPNEEFLLTISHDDDILISTVLRQTK